MGETFLFSSMVFFIYRITTINIPHILKEKMHYVLYISSNFATYLSVLLTLH